MSAASSPRPVSPSSPRRQKRAFATCAISSPTNRSIELTPDLQRLREMAKNEEPLDSASSTQIQKLIVILNQEKKALAKHHLYKEAMVCSNMINYVSKYYDSTRKIENQKIAKKEFAPIRKQFDDSFKDFDEETKILEKELILKQQNRLEAFLEAQQDELYEFESRWNSDKKLRIYNKTTSDLNTMKRRISYLLVDEQFEEAEATEKDIAEKTSKEVFDKHFIMQSDYDRSFKNLRKKQNLELQTFKIDCDVELDKFRQDRKKLRQGYLNRELKLKAKENIIDNPDKLWVHQQTERIANTAGAKNKNMQLSPSSKMKVADFHDPNIVSLALPPLKAHVIPMNKTRRSVNSE